MSAEFHKSKTFKSAELSKCPFTGAGTPAKFSAGRGQTNRDFWPNSLNLKILSQLLIKMTQNTVMQIHRLD